jgi:hypothetical protein
MPKLALLDLQRLLGELETHLVLRRGLTEDDIEYIHQVSELVGREINRL